MSTEQPANTAAQDEITPYAEGQQQQAVHDDSYGPRWGEVRSEGDYVYFGNEKYLRSELASAFGGMMNPGLAPPQKPEYANPAPLGLSGFALTTFVLCLINCGARGVHIPNIVVGLGYFYGGAAQLIAGFFELFLGNTFGGVAFCSYGGFWMSWAAIETPAFGITAAYDGHAQELDFVVGLFMLAWAIFTFFMMIMTLKSTLAFWLLFFLLTITFLLLGIGSISQKVGVTKAGGVFGILTAFAAWYNAYAGLANPQNSYLVIKALPLPDLEDRWRGRKEKKAEQA
ncbi:mug86 [Candida metapsilosis]|uniref:Mug86 n=1 Tax=Candida metapsilosis TaxID=273372 RepID=A0A8H8DE07_9ASCO|nr:mug86 [Candida metapsilosis]